MICSKGGPPFEFGGGGTSLLGMRAELTLALKRLAPAIPVNDIGERHTAHRPEPDKPSAALEDRLDRLVRLSFSFIERSCCHRPWVFSEVGGKPPCWSMALVKQGGLISPTFPSVTGRPRK